MPWAEAAGVAVAMVVEKSIPFCDVDTEALRDTLRWQNAKVDWEQEIRPTPWSIGSEGPPE